MAAVAQRSQEPVVQILDREVQFVPFLAKDAIKLSARMVLAYLCAPTKSGKVCDERQAMRFVMLCKARGLNPWEGDAYIVGYDAQGGPQFSLITAHQAFLKRAEVHPEYDGMKSGVLVRRPTVDSATGEERAPQLVELEGDYFDDPDILVGGWATVFFKTRKIPMHRRLKLSVFNKGFSRWTVDPGGMIVKCAEADSLRSSFPNALGGMYLEGELQEFTPAVEQKPARLLVRPDGTTANGRDQVNRVEALSDRLRGLPEQEPEDDSGAGEASAETGEQVSGSIDLDESVLLDFRADLDERLKTADSEGAFQAIGRDLLNMQARLGERGYADLLARYQARRREWETSQGKRTETRGRARASDV